MNRMLKFFLMGGLGVGIFLAGGLAVRSMGRPPNGQPQEASLYYCPMHPTYTSEKPGDCPICHMRLVLHRHDPSGPSAGHALEPMPPGYAPVTLSSRKQQLLGVQVATVERRPLAKSIRTVGRIAYDPQLYQAQEEYLQALRAWEKVGGAQGEGPLQEQTGQLVEAARLRLHLMGWDPAQVDTMEAWTGPDRRLLMADSRGQVWLYAPIYEFEIPLVEVGQVVRVTSPSLAGEVWEGRIESIDPVLDADTRSVRVRALLTDSKRRLKPEMFVNVDIAVELGEVLALPEGAVFRTGTRDLVFLAQAEGVFHPAEVKLGAKAGEFFEVKEGLKEGDRVVASANFLIDSESRLKAALKGMGGEKEHLHAH